MCSICLKTPCDPRCPNAEEVHPVTTCAVCTDDVYEGEIYYDIPGFGDVCEDCIQNAKLTAEREDDSCEN